MPLFRRRSAEPPSAPPKKTQKKTQKEAHKAGSPRPGRGKGDERANVGGLWQEMGQRQLDFLRAEGLEPQHRLLDVGCGSLRAGIRFIDYLDPGNYYGIDQFQKRLDAGADEVARAGLSHKPYSLARTGTFDTPFGVEFDYALAQSVFSHLPLNTIALCLLKLQRDVKPGGRFYATFFPNHHGRGHVEPIRSEGRRPVTTFPHKDPYHYPPEVFEWLCEPTSWDVEYRGGWDHPRGQHMLCFTRR